MVYAFDTLGYATRLREAGVPLDQAEAHATAGRDFIMSELVTRSDLAAATETLRNAMDIRHGQLSGRIDLLDSRLDKLGLQLTVRLGAMLAAAVAILATLQRLS
ncbi:hypothetical protein PQJ75_09400 [Rhodoplanes sp. TEM]|uniref:DUF1640 domain-containing protein n=1 Tax=Rhodoplanes tepidamans TaxID=200616 RepID=A0ABT5J5S0_RHOTP|nr:MULTISPECIES: hypothetical protein [Rhodoplanes]MDC7784960.1 hypothetical protein [Rhodoplanes tepidamans]MDC7983944.1 hypothetical protein [Rhodoplanes sp. TEM]MDQ0353811.1 hypothetical protein [Rhodoplanes tepidamans]